MKTYVPTFKIDTQQSNSRATLALNIIVKANINKGSHIVDVGCGRGNLLSLLGEHGFQNISGVDRSSQLLSEVEQKTRIAILYHSDIERNALPFDSATIDVVCCMEVFEHLYDPYSLLQEIYRILIDEGLAIFSVPNEYRVKQRLKFIRGKSIYSPLKTGGHIKFFNMETIIEFVNMGFFIDQIICLDSKSNRNTSLCVKYFPSLFAKWFFIVARKK